MTTEETAPLNQYLEPVLVHRKLIVIVTLLAVAVGMGAGVAAPESYRSETSVLVYPVDADPTELLGSDQDQVDMATEVRIATSDAVAVRAADRLQSRSIFLPPATVSDGVTATSPKDSSILDIAFVAPTATEAQAGATAVAEAYLEFRSGLATNNKRAAETAITEQIEVLNQRLNGGDPVDTASVQTELAAQQAALASLSTLTVDATIVITPADLPEGPQGLSLIQLLVGAVAGGLTLGLIAAYAASAVRSPTPTPSPPETGAAPATGDTMPSGHHSHDADGGDQRPDPVADPEPGVPTPVTVPAPTPLPLDREEAVTAERSAARDAVAAYERTASEDHPVTDPAVTIEVAERTVEPDAPVEPGQLPPSTEAETVAIPVEPKIVSPQPNPADDRPRPAAIGPEPASERVTADERFTVQTVVSADDDLRALQILGSQPALTATAELDRLIEQLQELGKKGPVVGLTLGEEGVGTSIAVAFDLADALHSLGAKVLMIDAAVHDPILADLLGVTNSPGLAEVLTGEATLATATRPVGGLKGLDALTIGTVTDGTGSAVAGAPFERLLAEAKVDYHSILIIAGAPDDLTTVPSLADVADGLIVGTTQAPGQTAAPDLCRRLAALPAPTLEFLSKELVVERTQDAAAVAAMGM